MKGRRESKTLGATRTDDMERSMESDTGKKTQMKTTPTRTTPRERDSMEKDVSREEDHVKITTWRENQHCDRNCVEQEHGEVAIATRKTVAACVFVCTCARVCVVVRGVHGMCYVFCALRVVCVLVRGEAVRCCCSDVVACLWSSCLCLCLPCYFA